ncbi:MAG: CusA/CzcA family heavy metal efflux RND transporter [Rhodomicrobium sp.]
MLNALVTFGLTRRPVIVLMLFVFIVAGALAFSKLNIEAYPNPAPVILEITAQSAGLSAEEMERLYTIPMEVGLAPTPGVNNIRSTSFYGLSFVRVTFDYGVDYYFALQQTQISLLQNVNLPNNVQPQIQASSLVGEVYRYQVVGPKHFGITNLRTVQDWILQRRLLTVPGVVQVNTWGGTTKEYEVEADLDKLEAYNVTLPQLVSAVSNANVNVGARTVNIGKQSVNIRGVGLINTGGNTDLTQGRNVEDIESITLGQSNGVPVQIKDVAKVYVGNVPRLGKAGRDGDDDVVAAILVMNRTLHTNDVIARIKAEVAKINSDGTLPPGVKLVPFYDRTSLVNVTSSTVLHNLIFGSLLVFFIQWVFLGDLRSAIIVGINIPFALFFSIIILVLRGEDANLLSLGAVDFGIIIDSAVILVENIFRVFQAREREEILRRPTPISENGNGIGDASYFTRIRLIYISATQVDRAVLFSTAITLAAFVPLFTMQGVEGQIFGPMARTYAYALIGALLATFTISPVLASFLLPEHVEEGETIVVRAIRAIYTPVLRLALRARRITVFLGLAFLLFGGLLASQLGTEFLPALEEGNLWIRASMPPTISLEAGEPIVNRIREILKSHPEVITVVSQHGRPDNGSDATGFFNAEFFVPLKPFGEWEPGRVKEDLVKDLQAEFSREFTGIDFNFSQYIQDNIEEGLSGVKGANSVKIIGPNLFKLEELATQVERIMSGVRGVTDLGIFRVLGQPNLNIKADREKAARYGLNAGDVNTFVQTAFGGNVATTIYEADRQFGVNVRAAPKFRDSLEAVRNAKINVTTPNGNAYIPLTEVADITLDTGASYIFHERNERFIPIKFSVRGRDLGGAVAEAKQKIADSVTLPSGYRMEWAGEFEELEQAQRRLEIAVPLSIVLILGLLYGLFNSIRESLLVLTGIPFAVAGGIIALSLSGESFGISAAIGFVSLSGVSVMNGILIMTYFNESKHLSDSVGEAMFNAATQRMRPMLMTALSACLGLLPAAVSTGIGSQVQRPLAIVVVGGMLVGPIMLLIVVPALQTLFLGGAGGGDAQAERPAEEPETV